MPGPDHSSTAPAPTPRLFKPPLLQLAALGGGALVFLFLMVFSIAPYFAASPTKGASEEQFKSELDRSVPRILHHFHTPGVVISTVVNGAPSRTYAYGWAEVEHRRAMTADTVFRVASISKSLTAWGILRLVQDGKVSLDSPAERYLQSWPLPPSIFPSAAVTVRSLLNHTSGLNAGGDTFRRPDERANSAIELLDEAGPGGSSASLIAPAGMTFTYSVPGYTILQMIVENQSHQPFAAYMKRVVLQPLGMESSSFEWDERLRNRTATPYVGAQGASAINIPQDLAADSLFATGPDIARFIAAPLPDKFLPAGAGVLSPDSVAQFYRDPAHVPSLQLAGFAPDLPTLGAFIERAPGQPVIITNGGYDPGWSSRFYIVPATGDGIAILTNSDRAQPVIAQIASIWSSWRGLPPTEMTRAYRDLGVEADAAISLLMTLGILLAGGLMSVTNVDAAFRWPALAARALEAVLAAVAVGIWSFAQAAVGAMPTLNAVGSTVIALFALVVVIRIIVPICVGLSAQRANALAT